MSSEEETILENFIKVLMTIAFGAWAWIVKTTAHEYITSNRRIEAKVDKLGQRVSKLEGRMEIEDEPEDN